MMTGERIHVLFDLNRSVSSSAITTMAIGSSILLEGGMLVNSCSGLAFSETNLLWPSETVQCIV